MPLKVLFASAEVAPFRKTGGLADVAGALPKALADNGVDVRVVTPFYQGTPTDGTERLDMAVRVPMYFGTRAAGVRRAQLPGTAVPVYLLENDHYYDRPTLYGYGDNLERFVFLSRGALELTKVLDWVPDVVHANDWHTALMPVYVNTVEWARPLHGAATVYTIHNLAYQGDEDGGAHFVTALDPEHFNEWEFEHFGRFNPVKAAIRHSTKLSTVSPRYAGEIQTSDFGGGLDGELAARRADLHGILNGIDTTDWDPARDPHIAAHFDRDDLTGKAVCKAALQREAGLAERTDVPLLGVVSRLTPQKGLDILADAFGRMAGWDLQLVLLGAGDPADESRFAALAADYPDKLRCFIGFDNGLAHRIEAGCDFLVIPSRFEPCGLNQMYSMRYGTLPIVRATGGLADSVDNYAGSTGAGTGFVFHDLTVDALVGTVGWALSVWRDRPEHILAMRRRTMVRDWSWHRAGAEYERLYLEAYARRRGHAFRG